jgi:quercetin dioxygenase-like cupin family protein
MTAWCISAPFAQNAVSRSAILAPAPLVQLSEGGTLVHLSALVIFLGMLVSGAAIAQDQPIKRTELLRSDLANVPGMQTVIYVADVVPGGEGQRHTHYGDEYVYILEGTLTVKPDGKDPINLSKGEVSHVAPNDGVHAAMNGSKERAGQSPRYPCRGEGKAAR